MTPNNFRVKSGLTVGTTISGGNTTISGFVNVTSTVNAAGLAVGTAFIANTTGVYHTGTVNAASFTVGATVVANSTGVYASHLGGTAAAGYQTTAGLAANVATLTSNNSTYAFGKSEADLNVNNSTRATAANTVSVTSQSSNSTTFYPVFVTGTSTGTALGLDSALSYVPSTDTLSLGNIIVSGNLTVSGTRTYVNTTTLDVGDNIITLNADLGAVAPTQDAGIEIMRGTSANVQFIWDETNDRWSTNSQPLAVSSLVAAGAASGITTLAAGNTTITGFANVDGNITSRNLLLQGDNTNAYIRPSNSPSNLYLGANGTNYLTVFSNGNFNVGSTLTVAGVSTFNSTVTLGSVGLSSNGSLGTAGQVLHSNGTATYWSTDDQGVTSVVAANGLNGGTITSTGTMSVLGGSTLTVNTTGVHVNSTLSITSLALAGALSGVTTAAMGNTTITGFVSANNLYANGTTGQSIRATVPGVAQGEKSALSMWATFTGTADNGPRRAVDIVTSFVGGAWGRETLTFNIGYDGVNDNSNTNIQRLLINATSFAANSLALSGVTTAAVGNTTITGFANVSSTIRAGDNITINSGSPSLVFTSTTSGRTSTFGMTDAYNMYLNPPNGGILFIGATSYTANVSMANNNITNPILTGYTEQAVANAAVTGTFTMDCAAANFFDLTLTGNTTISPSNVPPSTRVWSGSIAAKQDATGGRTITWPTGTKYAGGVAPPATTTANAIDIWSLMTYDGGTSWIVSLSVKGVA